MKKTLEGINNQRVQISPWEDKDLGLLFRINEPEMMEYLGGPETKEKVLSRHKRYLQLGDKGRMFSITVYPDQREVGCIGYWEKVWNSESIYEIGWSVLPLYQGRGIATDAARIAIDTAAAENKYEYIHAFPSIKNLASNAICRKLGFTFISEQEFEYPAGSFMRCNNWRLKLNQT